MSDVKRTNFARVVYSSPGRPYAVPRVLGRLIMRCRASPPAPPGAASDNPGGTSSTSIKLRSYSISDKLRVQRTQHAACQRVRCLHLQTTREESDTRHH